MGKSEGVWEKVKKHPFARLARPFAERGGKFLAGRRVPAGGGFGGRLLLAALWIGLILFLSAQPRLPVAPSQELREWQRAYEERGVGLKGWDALKEWVNQAAVRAMPAVDRFLGFYHFRPASNWSKFDFAVRKAGHWTVYFLLAVLLFFTLVQIPWGDFRISPYAWTLALGLLIAIADESQQGFLQGRTSAVQDIAVDAAGIIGALLLILLGRSLRPAIRAAVRAAEKLRRRDAK